MRRLLSAFLVAALALGLWYTAAVTYDPLYGAVDEEEILDAAATDEDSNTLTLWYCDEALTEYLSSASLSLQQDFGIKVNLVLKSGVEYLEAINEISITEAEDRSEAMPDLYITSHDNLLRAYLAGLASPVTDPGYIMSDSTYPNVALDAVTCYGQYVAYPLYYETAYFLYNKTYMASIAQNKLESASDAAEGQASEEAAEAGETEEADSTEESAAGADDQDEAENDDADTENQNDDTLTEDSDSTLADDGSENTDTSDEAVADDATSDLDGDAMGEEETEVSEEVLEELATMIPATLDDITTFANNYDAPEAVESVFKWDVTDIFYNYFFVGNYMEVGGTAGDNAAVFNIYNQQAVECLTAYQGMNQFFTIDTKTDNYDNILNDFIEGKLVFTVATTDAIAKITQAKADGEFEFDYGVTTLPDVSDLLKSRGLSVTDAVAVNGYSRKSLEANEFATYIVANKAGELYRKAGKVACDKNIDFDDPEISNVLAEYEKSMPLPKMVEAANYWVQLEIAFTDVWNGADPDETLRALSDTIGGQIEEIRANLPTQESFSAGAGKFIQ